MQKRFYLTPAAVIIFILYFTVFGDRGLLRINHLHRDRDEIQKKFLELQGENDKLRREISALQSDRRYLESIARRDFGLVRSNEVIYQFPAQDKAALPAPGGGRKSEAKVDQKPAQKNEAKVDQKRAQKSETKIDQKTAPKNEAQVDRKPVAKGGKIDQKSADN